MATFAQRKLKLALMPIIFICIIVLFLAGNGYVFARLLQSLSECSVAIKWGAGVVFWLCPLCFFGTFLSRGYDLPFWLGRLMYIVGTGWLVFILYMVVILLVLDILSLVHFPSHYKFLIASAVVVPLLSYGYINYTHPKTRVIEVPILPDGCEPMTIVGVSDVHLGYGTSNSRLKRYVDMINAHEPDAIIIAGDLIDNSVEPLYKANMAVELNKLHAPEGIYMVPGNHEYISGIRESENFIKHTSIKLLRDSTAYLSNGVRIIGRDDRSNHRRKSVSELTKGADSSTATILLDHQPLELGAARENNVGLQFSGHTHRGQIFPLSLITDKLFEQSYGLTNDRSYIYVSSGLSLWGPPFRIGTDSELIVFKLTPKQQ